MNDLIAQLRKLIADVRPSAEWEYSPPHTEEEFPAIREKRGQYICEVPNEQIAVYIATANPQNITSLLDRIEQLERENKKLKRDLNGLWFLLQILAQSGSRLVRTCNKNSTRTYESRLYVNNGETATAVCAKHKTLSGAKKWAESVVSK